MEFGSRSQIKEMAKKGRIKVNDKPQTKTDLKIDPQIDQIYVDNQLVVYEDKVYYMLHKPMGVISATKDAKHKLVVDLLGDKNRKDIFPVGRLDIDTEGLLLLTNDGFLAHELLSPKKHVDKTYYAHIKGQLPIDAVEQMNLGLVLEDGTKTLPANLTILDANNCTDLTLTPIEITIHEGKYHQIKRMFQALDCEVVYLKRISMGMLKLDESLQLGEFRSLTEKEVKLLYERNQTTKIRSTTI